MNLTRKTVVVVGGGTMGVGIAAGLALHGIEVALLLRDAARSEAVRGQVDALLGALAAERPAATVAAVAIETLDGFDLWATAALVIETVKEDLALKRQLFAWLDTRVPERVPIGSNSSSYPISRIAEGLAGRARMFGTHYFMPAHRVPLVEVVLGADSDAALGQHVCELFAAAGKKPVLVKKDIAGFLANRIQHALMREALALIDAGIASPEDVDTAVRYSFGFRYAAIGPIVQKEISGWDTSLAASKEIYPTLANNAEPPRCLERLVAERRYGMKTGEGFMRWTPEAAEAARRAYDQRLAAALKLLE